jgi:alpha-glucosidase (family GH31 glycosyl hydrolase)
MMNFPSDVEARGIDQQFMWGDGLLITPVQEEGAVSVTGYFPPSARWFDLRTGTEVLAPATAAATAAAAVANIAHEEAVAARALRGGGAGGAGPVFSVVPVVGAAPGWFLLAAPLDYIPLHVRGGRILPTQAPETTTTARCEMDSG